MTAVGALVARALAVAAALLGAVLPVNGSAAGRGSLADWTRDELVPYVTEQLSRHPRFRGERVTLVALTNGDVAPRIDGLSASLRTTLTDALLAQQGVRLGWERSGAAAGSCAEESAPGYFLGIEVTDNGGGAAAVSVRALDRQERSFVPGFGRRWEGRLSRRESAALRTRKADESLRGQRALPFDGSQADLIAAHVAGKLTCQLRRRGLDGRPTLPAGQPDQSGDDYGPRMEALVSNYLARGQLAVASGEAPLTIAARLHPIDEELAQLWITAASSADGGALPAAAVDVYLDRSVAPVQPSTLLSNARLVHTGETARCGDERTWRSAKTVRPIVSGWPTSGCVALEVEAERSVYLFVIAHPGNGRLRLLSSACQRRTALEAADGVRRFVLTTPEERPARSPSFYVVATTARADARALDRYLQQLCGERTDDGAELERWLSGFETLLAGFDAAAEWRVVRAAAPAGEERT